MKYLIILCLLVIKIYGFEYATSQVVTPSDLGIQKIVYTAKPKHLFIYSIRITTGGIPDPDVSFIQANAEKNEIIYISGFPPWSKGTIFQLPGVGFCFDGYSLKYFTGNGSNVFDYKLTHSKKEEILVSIRIRELSYAETKKEFPEIPAEPELNTKITGWSQRYKNQK